MPDANFLPSLRKVVQAERLLTSPAQLASYETDALTAYHTRPLPHHPVLL